MVVQHHQLCKQVQTLQLWSLVTAILLNGCETWTLLAKSEERIQAFETKCMKKLLHISYLEAQDQQLGVEQN